MKSNMALLGFWENVILTKIILTTDGTIGCAKSDTWCQMVVHHFQKILNKVVLQELHFILYVCTYNLWCQMEHRHLRIMEH